MSRKPIEDWDVRSRAWWKDVAVASVPGLVDFVPEEWKHECWEWVRENAHGVSSGHMVFWKGVPLHIRRVLVLALRGFDSVDPLPLKPRQRIAQRKGCAPNCINPWHQSAVVSMKEQLGDVVLRQPGKNYRDCIVADNAGRMVKVGMLADGLFVRCVAEDGFLKRILLPNGMISTEHELVPDSMVAVEVQKLVQGYLHGNVKYAVVKARWDEAQEETYRASSGDAIATMFAEVVKADRADEDASWAEWEKALAASKKEMAPDGKPAVRRRPKPRPAK